MARSYYFSTIILSLFMMASAVYGQYLIQTSAANRQASEQYALRQMYGEQDDLLMVVPSLQPLRQLGIEFEVLDDDMETARHYRIENKREQSLRLSDLQFADEVKILWQNHDFAIVRTRLSDLPRQLDRNYYIKPLNFWTAERSPKDLERSEVPPKEMLPLSIIQTILDSVNVEHIYQLERHLSGEEAFWNGTQFDSIMSRYSYSTEIYKAETYIDNYLQQLGYPTELQPFSVATFYDIQFVNGHSDDGWLTTEGKIFGTSDGGQTWQVQFGNSSAGIIWSVFPIDQQTAVAVGDNGLILKTTNGATWQIQSSSTSSFLFGVYFRSQTQGWIAGDNGVILKTTDGGATWNTKNTPASSRLYDIFFTNDNLGWAVGRDGTILHTRDGGETWALQSSGTGSRLYGVHFLDENTGFAVGWGIALKTTNGGSSWSQLSVPTGVYYYDVDFIDTNNGMIVGWDGTCLSTTDGGNTWTTGGNIFDKDLYAFDMVNTTAVWASGNTIVAHSDDTGMSWQSGLSNIPETTLNNVIATKTGTQYPDEYYIICGHYDDTSEDPMNYAPGADDNASGTVGVMEAARVLSEYNFHYSIKFILFAGEEQGLWGSAAYASNAASNGEQILGVLNMDMIGYDGNMDGSMEIHEGTMSASQTLGNFVAANINNWGLPIAPQIKTYNSSSASDHSSFWNYGYPAILVIEDMSDFTPFYHSTNDLLSTLNPSFFLNNARATIGSLALLAEIDSTVTGLSDNKTVPEEFKLYAPYPNPFNPRVNIEYSLPAAQKVVVEIYDLLGRSIRQLVNAPQQAGNYQLQWDGITEQGAKAPSGIYFVRLQAKEQVQIRKMALIR